MAPESDQFKRGREKAPRNEKSDANASGSKIDKYNCFVIEKRL